MDPNLVCQGGWDSSLRFWSQVLRVSYMAGSTGESLASSRPPSSQQPQDSPPSLFHATRPLQYLFTVTRNYFGTSMDYIRPLLVTEHADELNWDGFRSLYRIDYSSLIGALPICEDEPSVARSRLDFSFLCDKDRAHALFIDIREAKKIFTLACISCLTRGNHAARYDPLVRIIFTTQPH